jgi:DNA-3-methyladenine glycosylase
VKLDGPVVDVAPTLLNAVLRGNGVAVRLTEVEAYEGLDDPASHAFRGLTARTSVMFGPPGHLYCYFTYGMHWCANVVCDVEGRASAVLLRAGAVVRGLDLARERRAASRRDIDLARGPARLAAALGLGAAQNGADLCAADSSVRLESMPLRRRGGIVAGPRIGIAVAQEQPWRFWLTDDPTVSAFRTGGRKRTGPARQTDARD